MRSTAGRRGEQVLLPPHAPVGAHGEGGREGGREGVLTDEVLDLLDPRPKVGLPLDRVLRTTRGKAFQSDSTGQLCADALLLVRCRGLTREKGAARASCTLRARARTGRAGRAMRGCIRSRRGLLLWRTTSCWISSRVAASRACQRNGSQPNLRRDWAHPCHICARTGLVTATSAPRLLELRSRAGRSSPAAEECRHY